MKTRKYKAKPLRSEPRSGVAPYTHTEVFGYPAAKQAHARETEAFLMHRDTLKATRIAERERQLTDAGLNWDLVRTLLDSKLGLTLDEAKCIVEELQTI